MDVFISYSHHDDDVAKDIEERLKAKGLEPFLDDKMDAGTIFTHEINDNLRSCKEVFALISHNSLKSEWVLVEYGAVLALGKHVSPVLIGCTADSLPGVLRNLQAKKYSKIDEVIEACKSRKRTVPDITGEWKYEYRMNDNHRWEGICEIEKDRRDQFRLLGTRKRETREGLFKRVKKPWNTEWAEILPDQKSSDKKLTTEYKMGGFSRGIMSLRIPPQGPFNEFGGEVFLLPEGPKDGPVHGTIEFKKANSHLRKP